MRRDYARWAKSSARTSARGLTRAATTSAAARGDGDAVALDLDVAASARSSRILRSFRGSRRREAPSPAASAFSTTRTPSRFTARSRSMAPRGRKRP